MIVPQKSLAYLGRKYARKQGVNKKFTTEICDSKETDVLTLDLKRKEHFALFAMSGGGKTYSIGVLTEELNRLQQQSENHGDGILILDLLGNHNTYDTKNNGPEIKAWNEKLKRTEIKPFGMNNVKQWVPLGDSDKFVKSMYDFEFAIKPHCFKTSTLCFVFGYDITDPIPMLYERAKKFVAKEADKGGEFDFEDLIHEISENGKEKYRAKDQTVEALISKLRYIQTLGIVSNTRGVILSDLIKEKVVTVLNLSQSNRYIKDIIVLYLIEEIASWRKRINNMVNEARKKEVAGDKNFRVKIDSKKYIPIVRLILEEAHEYFKPKKKDLKDMLIETLKEGRNYGLIFYLITQNPDLDDLIYTNLVHIMVGQINTNKDINKIRSIIAKSVSAAEFKRELKQLGKGCFYYFNQDTKQNLKIKVRPRMTLHLSGTEIVNEKRYLKSQSMKPKEELLQFMGKKVRKMEEIPDELKPALSDLIKKEVIKQKGQNLLVDPSALPKATA